MLKWVFWMNVSMHYLGHNVSGAFWRQFLIKKNRQRCFHIKSLAQHLHEIQNGLTGGEFRDRLQRSCGYLGEHRKTLDREASVAVGRLSTSAPKYPMQCAEAPIGPITCIPDAVLFG